MTPPGGQRRCARGQIIAPAVVPKRDGTFQSTYFHISNHLNPSVGLLWRARE
jgi:hypothetical protein